MRARLEATALTLIVFGALVACNALVGFGTLEKVDAVAGGDGGAGGGGGSSSSSSSSSSGDVDTEGGTNEGGPQPNAKCDLKKQFKTPVKMPGPINSGSHETTPTLTADELTIFFQRTVGVDGGNILMATRPSINDPFGDPSEVTALGGTGGSYSPTVTGDGLSLFWVEVISGDFQIFHSTRATKTSAWSARQAMNILNTNKEETFPFITNDGSELYFTSDRTNVRRIYRSKREAVGGDYLAPTEVQELRGVSAGETGFTLSPDGLFAYVGSDRTGTLGGVDIFRFERTTPTGTFNSAPVNVPELNSPQQDWPGWISPDGCRFYFGSLRVNPGELYMASRDP